MFCNECICLIFICSPLQGRSHLLARGGSGTRGKSARGTGSRGAGGIGRGSYVPSHVKAMYRKNPPQVVRFFKQDLTLNVFYLILKLEAL